MRLLYLITVITVSISFHSCKEPSRIIVDADNVDRSIDNDTIIKLYSASITLPKNWRLANDDTLLKSADATVRYRFQNGNNKLFYLDYGLGTNGNPSEPTIISARFRKGYINNKADTSEFLFSDHPSVSGIRKASPYHHTKGMVSEFAATFFTPKKIGAGYTGVYIDSIGTIGDNIADLVFYAEALDSVEVGDARKVIESLRLQRFN